MEALQKYLQIVSRAYIGNLVKELNPDSEQELINELEILAKEMEMMFRDKRVKNTLLKSFEAFSRIEAIEALIGQKVYLNEYSNKNGNKYIQARTSISKPDGKTSWLNAYVGPLENFKLGTKDPDALKIGKELIRKKLIYSELAKGKNNLKNT